MTQVAIVPAPCHTPTPPLVASAFFTGLVSSSGEVLNTVGSTDDVVTEENFGGSPHPQQMAALQIQNLEVVMAAATSATRAQVVATQDAARRADAAERVAATVALNLPTMNPSSS